ncbi:MAG: N-acetylmuramoyl-L-alanine amidase [Candidatus Hydrogenedentes bacterium]|nr:N-acetylmuramoyl-L-alanine amidase [Candidatus Hydrogenedentota bacterium]
MQYGGFLAAPFVWLLIGIALTCCAQPVYAASASTHAPLAEGASASIRVGRALYLECRPPKGKERDSFLRKYLADPKNVAVYKGVAAAAIPFSQLNAETQRAVLLAIFRNDVVDARGWTHEVTFAGEGGQETLGLLCQWITGRSDNYKAVASANHLKTGDLTLGQKITFPATLLSAVMKRPTPKRLTAPADPEVSKGELTYGRDGEGEYAVYHLKQGEALFTAVAVRFTDYRDTADILKACDEIQKRSGIKDVHAMATGQRIKIPAGMLADRYRPEGTEERKHYEESVREAKRLRGQVRSHDLEGVVIVIDPGHGGRDYGAHNARHGLYEDELNYDIACRVKALLETTTRAKVYMTLLDPGQQYKSSSSHRFEHDTDEELLTTPRYKNSDEQETDAVVSVNLRWYLANSIYRKETKRKIDPRKIVFTSFHCDALYDGKSRGAMVYIPGAAYRGKKESHEGTMYDTFAEVREQRYFRESASDCRRDEALSRNFAGALVDALEKGRIKVHQDGDPIRSQIRQSGGRVYVPGVLRNNLIPTKTLVEVANLTNSADCERLADPAWRQSFAEAYVAALRAFFGS